jgi:hypothetical protein
VLAAFTAILWHMDHASLPVTGADLAAASICVPQMVFGHQLREVHVIVQHLHLLLEFPKPKVPNP